MTNLSIGTLDHGTLYEHVVCDPYTHWNGEKWMGIVALCGMAHSKTEYVDWLDCPVAGRWTSMRSRQQSGTVTE